MPFCALEELLKAISIAKFGTSAITAAHIYYLTLLAIKHHYKDLHRAQCSEPTTLALNDL